ncbi:MAG TPA: copper amine oxidase N-terminal domain-containing protein [Clostridiaceae bacterium]|nr:copper amine oxidase N-terminal domain-containing protein [Clostridiaceae bacterium]
MRKTVLCLSLCLLVMIIASSSVFASGEIMEAPYVDIIINGNIVSFDDVPVFLNNRVLLPLRALLRNLGVKDDDEHIIWNGQEKSVTVYHDHLKIYLKIGDKTAYINNEKVQLDAEPVIYNKNQRTYIPVRFMSQAIGKKVAWDNLTKTVYVADESQYESVNEVLNRADAALDGIGKARIDTVMDVNMTTAMGEQTFKISTTTEIDMQNKIIKMTSILPLGNSILKFESYYLNNAEYIKNAYTGKWTGRKIGEEEFDKLLYENLNMASINDRDVMCAGLIAKDGSDRGQSDEDEIVLKGNICPKNILAVLDEKIGIGKFEPEKYHVSMYIVKSTGLIKKMVVEAEGKFVTGAGSSVLATSTVSEFKELDGNYNITIPKEVQSIKIEE